MVQKLNHEIFSMQNFEDVKILILAQGQQNSLISRVKEMALYATSGRPSRPLTPGVDRERQQIFSSECGQRWPPI